MKTSLLLWLANKERQALLNSTKAEACDDFPDHSQYYCMNQSLD